MSNLEKAWRYPLAVIMGLPYVPVALLCLWLAGILSFVWAVLHPTRMLDDGINAAIASWVDRNPDHVIFRASAWYENQIRKVLKMG